MAQMEQIFPVQTNKQINENQIQNRKKSSQITLLQNKIKTQEKNILSMQDYIKNLENKLKKKNYTTNILEENSKEYVDKLKQEKEDILSQLKQEIIINDEQRNYIEILKQALESNIILIRVI